MAERERDEQLIGQLVSIDDACRREGVNPAPVAPQIEDVIKAVNSLREAEDGAGLNRHQRTVIGDAVGRVTKAVQLK
jgi:hypothetical protein